MNEEELNNIINKVIRDERNLEQYARNEIPINEFIKEGFQKGKLEAIKDELNFLREIEKGTSCIDTKMFLKLRIEQLQKEIGGNEK